MPYDTKKIERQLDEANQNTLETLTRSVKEIQEISEKESTKAEKKASTTFRDLRYMIWIAFIFGLALIVVAIGLFIFEERSLEVLGLSTLGVADWIALFIYKPMDRLQKATADYAQLFTLLKGWAASINLQFFAMNSNNEESVRTSSKKLPSKWQRHFRNTSSSVYARRGLRKGLERSISVKA